MFDDENYKKITQEEHEKLRKKELKKTEGEKMIDDEIRSMSVSQAIKFNNKKINELENEIIELKLISERQSDYIQKFLTVHFGLAEGKAYGQTKTKD